MVLAQTSERMPVRMSRQQVVKDSWPRTVVVIVWVMSAAMLMLQALAHGDTPH